MENRKVVRLSNEVPNYIKEPISPIAQYLVEPILRGWVGVKKACTWLINAMVVLLLVGGLALSWFSWQAYNGRPTPFTTIEMIGLENSMQELAGSMAGVQDLLISLKMRVDKLEKKK